MPVPGEFKRDKAIRDTKTTAPGSFKRAKKRHFLAWLKSKILKPVMSLAGNFLLKHGGTVAKALKWVANRLSQGDNSVIMKVLSSVIPEGPLLQKAISVISNGLKHVDYETILHTLGNILKGSPPEDEIESLQDQVNDAKEEKGLPPSKIASNPQYSYVETYKEREKPELKGSAIFGAPINEGSIGFEVE